MMSRLSNSLIDVQNIGKQYRIKDPKNGGNTDFCALEDISFSLNRGDSIGVIGQNGSGKSTLLKIIANIVSPSQGLVRVRGNIASMLELGAGFHQELTGRENTYVYGSMVGLKRKEIRSRFDEIVDFAGISPFINAKVSSYSSGMIVRLAFSIATIVRPDVLLADEIFAVGDMDFRAKCLKRMEELKAQGTAMLVVDHDLDQISHYCDQGILLDHGRLVKKGDIQTVLNSYGFQRPLIINSTKDQRYLQQENY